MELNIEIGPYTLLRRTEYSKFQVLDNNGNNITKSKTAERIISDYDKQIQYPNKYFNIDPVNNNLMEYIEKLDLLYVFIPDGIKTIDDYSFSPSYLKYIHIPDTVESIGLEVFRSCNKLHEINIPNSVKMIGGYTFYGCKHLNKITLPVGMTIIPMYCFSMCESLKEIVLPDTIRNIDACAFWGCNSLEKINIPRDLRCFGSNPFSHSNIKCLSFNHDLKNSPNPKRFYDNFLGNSNIEKIEITNNVHHIDPNLFKYTTQEITEIDYLGTNKEFLEFKKNNHNFFNHLINAKVNILDNLDNLIDEECIQKDQYIEKYLEER